MEYDADLAVIGSGPAGEKGAVQAAYFGKRVILVERDELPGGTAVHSGTIPSKSFHESARRIRASAAPVPDPLRHMLERKETVRLGESRRVETNLSAHGVEIVKGRARITGADTLTVDGPEPRSIRARHILVATGSSPHHPGTVDFSDPTIDDADSITRLDHVPESLVVVGGGVIGSEYASIFAELGSRVTLVDARPRLLDWLDHEISSRLQSAFCERGMRLVLGWHWDEITRDGGRIRTSFSDSPLVLESERVLFAAGRVGATAGLGLEEAGVRLNSRGYVEVDEAYRTSVPGILAAGDVIGAPALASTSMEQGRVAVCRAFGFSYKQQVSALVPTGIYTIPEVAAVGLSEEAATTEGFDAVTGWAPFGRNVRGLLQDDTRGGVKLVFDRTGRRLLGVHIIGEDAAELVHTGQAVVALGGTVETLINMVFSYPTRSESYKYAAYDALAKLNEA